MLLSYNTPTSGIPRCNRVLVTLSNLLIYLTCLPPVPTMYSHTNQTPHIAIYETKTHALTTSGLQLKAPNFCNYTYIIPYVPPMALHPPLKCPVNTSGASEREIIYLLSRSISHPKCSHRLS